MKEFKYFELIRRGNKVIMIYFVYSILPIIEWDLIKYRGEGQSRDKVNCPQHPFAQSEVS